MPYIDACFAPVPDADKAAYLDHARAWSAVFKEMGAIRHLEAWPFEVPAGEINDLRMAVDLQPEESVIFGLIAWPDRATRDAAHAQMPARAEADPALMQMPFDGARMIFGGFTIDAPPPRGAPGVVDAMIAPAPEGSAEALAAWDAANAAMFRDHGAIGVWTCAPDDVPVGKRTDFHRGGAVRPGEAPVCGWVEWPDRATRDAGWAAMMADPGFMARMATAPYDMKRMAAGAYHVLMDM